MGSIKSIEEDRKKYCKYKDAEVNIHILKHGTLNIEYSHICDFAINCENKNCEYKGEDN